MSKREVQVLKKPQEKKAIIKKIVPREIIVNKVKEIVTYDEKGRMITERKIIQVNITKKINESAKVLKIDNASKTLTEIEKLLTKENN